MLSEDSIMSLMWREFILFAHKNPNMRRAFEKDTGKSMSDLEAFIRWATEKHWGLEYAPASYRDYIAPSTPEARNG